jgi:hypothetical protein
VRLSDSGKQAMLAENSIVGTEWHVRSSDVTGFKRDILQNRKEVLILNG